MSMSTKNTFDNNGETGSGETTGNAGEPATVNTVADTSAEAKPYSVSFHSILDQSKNKLTAFQAKSKEQRAQKKEKAFLPSESNDIPHMPVKEWYITFLSMNVPILGWIYLSAKASDKKSPGLRQFARAYILFKLTFLLISMIFLGIAIYVGFQLMDQLLAYMDML